MHKSLSTDRANKGFVQCQSYQTFQVMKIFLTKQNHMGSSNNISYYFVRHEAKKQKHTQIITDEINELFAEN